MRDAIPRTMRAAAIVAPGQVELREVGVPAPSASQVLVAVDGCGVCGSNLPVWEGRPWFTYPVAPGEPGHEGWGRVVARGRDVDPGLAIGARVAFLSGRAFADYDVADAAACVPLPAALDGADVPGEPLGCVANIVARGDVAAGHTVAVVGIGFLGALIVQAATRAGATVIAVSRRPWSLGLARRMGAAHALGLDHGDDEVVRRVEALTGGAGCDRVFEVIGAQRGLDVAARLCRVRGRLVIAGFHQDGPRTIDMFLWNWRGLDVINAHEREPARYVDGMRAAVAAVAAGALAPSSLYTHRVPLADAATAFELLRTRPDGFVKALVVP